jgi:hypothetical protein
VPASGLLPKPVGQVRCWCGERRRLAGTYLFVPLVFTVLYALMDALTYSICSLRADLERSLPIAPVEPHAVEFQTLPLSLGNVHASCGILPASAFRLEWSMRSVYPVKFSLLPMTGSTLDVTELSAVAPVVMFRLSALPAAYPLTSTVSVVAYPLPALVIAVDATESNGSSQGMHVTLDALSIAGCDVYSGVPIRVTLGYNHELSGTGLVMASVDEADFDGLMNALAGGSSTQEMGDVS